LRLIDPSGRSIDSGTVTLHALGKGGSGIPMLMNVPGEWTAEGIEPGRYSVHYAYSSAAPSFPISELRVTPGEKTLKEARLVLLNLQGTVTEAGTGAPVQGASLFAGRDRDEAPMKKLTVTTGPDGGFAVHGLPIDQCRLTARASGYGMGSERVRWSRRESWATVRIELRKAPALPVDFGADPPATPPLILATGRGFESERELESGWIPLGGTGPGTYCLDLSPGEYTVLLRREGRSKPLRLRLMQEDFERGRVDLSRRVEEDR